MNINQSYYYIEPSIKLRNDSADIVLSIDIVNGIFPLLYSIIITKC